MSLYILSAHPSMPSALRESLELTGEIVRQAERYSWQQMPAKNALHLPAKQRVDTPAFVICEATPPPGFGYHPNRVLRNKKTAVAARVLRVHAQARARYPPRERAEKTQPAPAVKLFQPGDHQHDTRRAYRHHERCARKRSCPVIPPALGYAPRALLFVKEGGSIDIF